MPDFNFAVVNARLKAKQHKEKEKKYNYISKKIEGVIFVRKDGSYYVHIDKDEHEYNINKESYSCLNKETIYKQGTNKDNRQIYIREPSRACECDPLYWLPFDAGSVVIGDIIKLKNNDIVFNIKSILHDVSNDTSRKAREIYKKYKTDIYNIINEARNKQNQ